MIKTTQLFLVSLVGFLPAALGQATLVPKVSTAQCSGHLKDLIITSATCQGTDYACTFGSEVFLTGQVTADYDIPRPMNVHLTNTFPSWYKMGINAYNGQVYDVCSSGVLTAPENEDAGYSCPSAGVYNFHTSFKVPGSRRNIFASWSGYSYGVNVHFKHDTEGGDWATCHMNIKVKKNEYGGYGTTAKFLSVAGLGLASIAMGVFYRRRRERVAGQDNEGDMGDQFELVNDHAAV